MGLRGAKTLLVFNIARDTRNVPERRRVQLSTIYLLLGYTGARSGEFVYNERKQPKEAIEIFGPAALSCLRQPDGSNDKEQGESHLLTQIVAVSNRKRGRSKAFCYEDILLSVVRDPNTGKDIHVLAIKLIHHKGEDCKPRP